MTSILEDFHQLSTIFVLNTFKVLIRNNLAVQYKCLIFIFIPAKIIDAYSVNYS